MNKINQKLFIGIDVSKDTLDIYYKNKSFKIKNKSISISAFIKAEIEMQDNIFCVFESTGGYERTLAKALSDGNIAFHIAHPNKVHNFAKASGHFAKTDKLDAILLYKYAKFISDQEDGDELLPEEHQDIVYLKRLSRSIEASLHAAQCRLKQMPKSCTKYLQSEIKFYKRQIEQINNQIQDKIDQSDSLKLKKNIMTSIKGVGNKIASSILAEMPEIGTLSRRQVASLAGLAPKTHQSGKKEFGGHIFGGRFYVRKALYMAALVASRADPKVKKRYEELIAKGKAKKVALVAIMRNFIVMINAMIKNNRFFDFSA